MTTARNIAEGLGSFLRFEQLSGRAELFSEKYLCSAIGQIMSGTGYRTTPEFTHPSLRRLKEGRGRRPAIDFVCRNHNVRYLDNATSPTSPSGTNGIIKAIESKWIGATEPTHDSVMWDIIRLSLVNRDYDADCFFVIGGRSKDLTEYFQSFPIYINKQNNRKTPIFQTPHPDNFSTLYGKHIALSLLTDAGKWRGFYRRTTNRYPSLDMPTNLAVRMGSFFPINCRSRDYKVICWQVYCLDAKSI